MFPGKYTLCLKTDDMEGMMHFYGALGMRTHVFQHNSAMAWNGDVHLALMSFLKEHSMNFRGTSPFELHRHAKASGIEYEGEPRGYAKEQFDADADGGCWLTHDPDGNNVFFDTNKLEMGARGEALFLFKILDATRRQLVNVEAPEECRAAFEVEVVNRFVTAEVKQSVRQDLTPLPEPGTFPGSFTYCLKVADTTRSREWYKTLGLEVGTPSEGTWVQMNTGDCHLALMNFLEQNWLNFRGADVFRIYEQMCSVGLSLEGEPERYSAADYGSAGMHWRTRDPEGNVVYFDTTDEELIEPGSPAAVRRVLDTACRQLEDVQADAACGDAIRNETIERFAL